jgi:hypothetical protein
LKSRDEIFPEAGRPHNKESSASLASITIYHHKEIQMTKVTFVSAALIAAAVFTTQAAMAARSDGAARHATAKAHTSVTDCVRAPEVGAFASDPYTVPPCLPNTATFQ